MQHKYSIKNNVSFVFVTFWINFEYIFRLNKNGRDGGEGSPIPEQAHIFQEYTYKKITPCDICSQILRGKYFMFENNIYFSLNKDVVFYLKKTPFVKKDNTKSYLWNHIYQIYF